LAVIAHGNDNHPIERHVPALGRQPALVGRWRQHVLTGRLECHWKLEAVPANRPAVSSLILRRNQDRSRTIEVPAQPCTGSSGQITLPFNDNSRKRPFPMQSKGSDRLPPEFWQTRADKVRAIADGMFDPQSRQTLLRIANEYENLAAQAQERERLSGSESSCDSGVL
jgi:hypothetical protein